MFSVLGSWCSRILRMLDYGCPKIRDPRKPHGFHHHLSLSYDKMATKWRPILDFSDTQPNQFHCSPPSSHIFMPSHTTRIVSIRSHFGHPHFGHRGHRGHHGTDLELMGSMSEGAICSFGAAAWLRQGFGGFWIFGPKKMDPKTNGFMF